MGNNFKETLIKNYNVTLLAIDFFSCDYFAEGQMNH